jgi:hypothetical protein
VSVAHTRRIRIEKHAGPHRTAHIEGDIEGDIEEAAGFFVDPSRPSYATRSAANDLHSLSCQQFDANVDLLVCLGQELPCKE